MDRKLFLTLWGMGIVGAAAVVPYLFTLQRDVLANAPMPLPAVAVLSVLQTGLFLGVLVYVGLRAATAVGLGAPHLAAAVHGRTVPAGFARSAYRSAAIGAAAAAVIAAVNLGFERISPTGLTEAEVPLWQRLLASLYGGITEELMLRLFLVSVLAWCLSKLLRRSAGSVVMWTAIVVSSVAFGLGHLPATAALVAITPMVVLRALVLNGIGGLVFGWLYWRQGLESAMIAHFTADVVLHGLFAR